MRREIDRRETVMACSARDNEGLDYRITKRTEISRVKCDRPERRRAKGWTISI